MLSKEKQHHPKDSRNKQTSLKVSQNTELMLFLLAQLPHKNRNNIKSLLKNKQVFVNGRAETQFDFPLTVGQMVEVRWNLMNVDKQDFGIEIVYEDNDIIIVEKEAGMLCISTEKVRGATVYNILKAYVKSQNPANKIFIVHRLDRDTSGLMMFAKSEKMQKMLQESWNATILERTYIAVTEGIVAVDDGTISSYLKETKDLKVFSSQNPHNGDWAVTHFVTLKRNKDFSMLKLNLETGRKNQIRVHLQDIGHSIVGDKKYGAKSDPIGRLGLHALVLAFNHPISGELLRFESKIPRKFMRLF